MTRTYRHLPSLDACKDGFSIRCLQDRDVEEVRQWRNAQLDVLRQAAPISQEEQARYFAREIWPQMDCRSPDTVLVAIERVGEGECERIGYGGLVHCDWRNARAEVSVLFAPDLPEHPARYRLALLAFLAMIAEVGFTRLGLNRLTLETYATRSFHIGVLEEAGFVREGRLRAHVLIDGRPVDSLLHARLAKD